MSTVEFKQQPAKRVVLNIKTNKYPFFLELVKKFDFIQSDETPVEATTQETKSAHRNVSRFKSLLTADEACKYHQYLQTARQEWDRNI
jgi:predicted translin family RNA/ssDNA-binding protein